MNQEPKKMKTLFPCLLTMLPLVFSLSVSAASLPDIPQVAKPAPIDVTAKKFAKTIEFRKLSTQLNSADSMGKAGSGMFCGSETPLFYKTDFTKGYANILSKMFAEETRKFGYPEYSPSE